MTRDASLAVSSDGVGRARKASFPLRPARDRPPAVRRVQGGFPPCTHIAGAELEVLAGDTDAAERELRDAIDVATEMGATRYVALYRTKLARVLLAQDRSEDAAAELEHARDLGDAPAWRIAG